MQEWYNWIVVTSRIKLFDKLARKYCFFFLNVGPPKESILLTTFYGLFSSHQYTNITNYISSWLRVHAHFYAQGLGFYSISTICQSAEYILELYIHILIQKIQLLISLKKIIIKYLFSLKNSRPCRDLNPGLPRYQVDMLPIELSWLGYEEYSKKV